MTVIIHASLGLWAAIAWCATGEPFLLGAAAVMLVEGWVEVEG